MDVHARVRVWVSPPLYCLTAADVLTERTVVIIVV